MDSSANRATKRRKLDTPNDDLLASPSGSHNRSTPITSSQNASPGTSKSAPARKPATTHSSAHQALQQARANSTALRSQRKLEKLGRYKGVDVYDDIEGAHGERNEPVQSPASTPVKKQLDPLRNQKSPASASPSRAKPGLLKGFFKQFTVPKSESETSSKQDVDSSKKINGVSKGTGRDSTQGATAGGAEVGDEAESSLDRHDTRQISSAATSARAARNKWTYETGKKKTLEDEIKELGNAARMQAEGDDDGGPAATASSSQRKRNRTSKFGTTNDEASESTSLQKLSRSTPKQHSTLKEPRKTRDSVVPVLSNDDAKDADAMEVDEPDDAQPEIEEASPAPTKVQSKTASKLKPQQRKQTVGPSIDVTFSPEHLQHIQTILLEKLTGKRRICLSNLEQEYGKVSNLISQTVTAGESNSMLLIGARGSGKSALVNQILHEQAQEHPDDFHVVRLSGFIHTDDKIALREIWRQLGREMELGDDDKTSKNYSDTLTTLLALLSHPAELGQEQHADHVTKSVIFILDQFELFASHPRQTLLYNLFDIAQSRKAPIAVLGLTTRIDVSESLEKRVKSRFSHRYVHLGFAKSFTMFEEACKAALTLHHNELSHEEREALGARSEITETMSKVSKKQERSVVTDWNSFIELLCANETFASHLRRIYYTTKSIPEFHASMLVPICGSVDSPTTSPDLVTHFTSAIATSTLAPPDSNLTLLSSLSTLQLALLICAARLTNIHSTDVVPFAQAYEEYKVLASKQKVQASASGALAQGAGSRVWSKDIARGAWEDLIKFGLVMEDGSRGVRVDVGLEEIGMSGVDLGSWGRWCREI